MAELITAENFSVFDMALSIVAAISISIPLTYLGIFIQFLFLGRIKDKNIAIDQSKEQAKQLNVLSRIFSPLFKITLLEELFARWLFLGILTQVFPGRTFFLLLLIMGNGLWAIIHKYNFRNKADQKNLRTLPQFLMGFVFSYIFVKYGLLACILTHFGHNAIVFSVNKREKFKPKYLLVGLYYLVFSALFFYLQRHPITDILSWFYSVPVFKLVGWNFWDYIILDLFVFSVISTVLIILTYDGLQKIKNKDLIKQVAQQAGPPGSAQNEGAQSFFQVFNQEMVRKKKQQDDLWRTNKVRAIWNTLKISAFGSTFLMIFFYGLYWLSGLIISDVPFRILTLTILFCFLIPRSSMNGMARDFWMNLPGIYIMISVVQALDSIPLIFAFFMARVIFGIPISFVLDNKEYLSDTDEQLNTENQNNLQLSQGGQND